ncbi:hypothetical protein RvY_15556 [Ramazzottius varieornatus]|uniref:sn-1-specific diacylglycerol lipase ABHD11 n=1 Tax=Ramazzottius varieornatus TaxID=947166 RepID=A0A1D1VVB8_RAMVA|nr:hypothetical protein RvY_15556 [Ramazzottius varieornatus]
MAIRTARQSARLCNLIAIKLVYDKFDPPRSSKPPIAPYPLIICHGIFGNRVYWHVIAKTLVEQLRQSVICADARNHGESPHDPDQSLDAMSDDVEELIHTLKIPKAILVGHSMPALIDALIVVDTAPALMPGVELFREMIRLQKELDLTRGERLDELRKRAVEEWDDIISKIRIRIREFLVTNLVEKDGQIEWRINLKAFEKYLDQIMEFPEYDNSYNGPVLFIKGDQSDYITEKEMPEINRLFPENVVVTLPGTHWVHQDSREGTIESIVNFMKDLKTD